MRVLIADDDPVLRHALARQLAKWNFDPVVCANGLEVRALINEQAMPPLALIDWNMPGVDGLSLCGEIRAMPEASTVYLILITSNRSRADVVSGLTCGADDYIVKPFDWEELRARVNIGARTVALQERLRILAIEDDLTGLYNRRGFATLAERHLALARRKRQSLMLLAADLDGLKSINDNYGHAAGDQALRAAAMSSGPRIAALISWRGWAATNSPFSLWRRRPKARSCCSSACGANLDAYNAQRLSGWKLSMSAGMARLDAATCESVQQLLEEADRALYQQKRLRRGVRSGRLAGL